MQTRSVRATLISDGEQYWTANFFDAFQIITAEPALIESGSINLEIDIALLAELFERFKPDDHSFVHESVTKYKELRETDLGSIGRGYKRAFLTDHSVVKTYFTVIVRQLT